MCGSFTIVYMKSGLSNEKDFPNRYRCAVPDRDSAAIDKGRLLHQWIANCRYDIIEKRYRQDDEHPSSLMIIRPEDLPNLEKEIKELKKCVLFTKCLTDRDAGKVKHCYENDRRWRSIFQLEK
jgi:hypothetical protein